MEAARPPVDGLFHVALNVADVGRARAFYRDVLGFRVEWEPDPDNVYLTSGTDNLALHRSAGRVTAAPTGPADSSGQALDHLGLLVREADDVDRWAAFLESRGIALDAPPRTHRDGARSCYLSDPDGNKIQIIHHPPISKKS